MIFYDISTIDVGALYSLFKDPWEQISCDVNQGHQVWRQWSLEASAFLQPGGLDRLRRLPALLNVKYQTLFQNRYVVIFNSRIAW